MIGAVAVKLLVKLFAGVIGRKLTIAIAMAYVSFRAAGNLGAGRAVRRARAWLSEISSGSSGAIHDSSAQADSGLASHS